MIPFIYIGICLYRRGGLTSIDISDIRAISSSYVAVHSLITSRTIGVDDGGKRKLICAFVIHPVVIYKTCQIERYNKMG